MGAQSYGGTTDQTLPKPPADLSCFFVWPGVIAHNRETIKK